jgi:ABC-type proline/glycine betaine transport system permease subunit
VIEIRWQWIIDHLDDVGEKTWQHVQLLVIPMVIGFAIAFTLAIIATRRPGTVGPVTAVTGLLYTIPSLAAFALLIPITGLSLSNDGPTADGSVTSLTAAVTGGTNVVYDWDLGDGTVLTDAGPTITHIYPGVDTYTATVTATNPIGADTATTTVAIEEQVTPPVLINAGGGSFVDSLSRTWVGDTAFSGGKKYSNGVAISGTTDDSLYQTERWGNVAYAIPVQLRAVIRWRCTSPSSIGVALVAVVTAVVSSTSTSKGSTCSPATTFTPGSATPPQPLRPSKPK